MTTLTNEVGGIIGKCTIYVAKVSGPRLIMKSEIHRGIEGILYDAKAYVDVQLRYNS